MKRYFFTALILLPALVLIRAEQPTSKVVSARLVHEHTVSNDYGSRLQQGDVEVTFADGRTELLTHDGKCGLPEVSKNRVSKNGAVLWIHCNGLNEKGYTMDEKTLLRTPEGSTIELKDSGVYQNSVFTLDGAALVVMWSDHHNHPWFIKYDANNGKVISRISDVYEYNKLPSWAKPAGKGWMD